jgi:hypothetical protein
LTGALAITPDGRTIVGYGKSPGGNSEAWIANLDPPSLTIRRHATNVIVSWPTNDPGFVLEMNSSPITSTSWNTNSSSPFILGTDFVVTNSINAERQFFRLKK